jgi:preprotein translocase subunit SecF
MIRVLHGTNIDFMGKRKIAYAFSLLLTLIGVASLVMKGGPKTGVDFAGGSLLDLRFSTQVAVEDLRSAAEQAGLVGAEIQTYEGSNDALFRIQEALAQGSGTVADDGPAQKIQRALSAEYPGIQVETLRQEVVGPKVGAELRGKATLAILVSVLLIMIYVAFRFHRWEFGLGGAVALAHDVMVTLSIFSIFNIEIGLTVLAAFLTIAGFSINDTIVVFDRVRENMERHRKMPLADLMNLSINQTLSRTILTVLTVLVTAGSLFVLGGEVIRDFALAILIGIGFGSYSSIFVATALALDLDNRRQKKLAEKAAATGQAAGKPAVRASEKATKSARTGQAVGAR